MCRKARPLKNVEMRKSEVYSKANLKSEDNWRTLKQLRVVMKLFRVIATAVITHVRLLCLVIPPLLCINSSYFIFGNSNSIILANITFAHVTTSYFWALSALFVQCAALFLLERFYLASKLHHRKAQSKCRSARIQIIPLFRFKR